MLSIKKLTNVTSTSHYYEQDNYYEKDSQEAKVRSAWLGTGSKILGLDGQVDSQEFRRLLEGHFGDKRLGRNKDGKWSHTPGWDLTFSAPKSVSIAIEIGDNRELLDAHLIAVKETMKFVEDQAAQARVAIDGKNSFIQTKNIVAATFLHNTSRELDPQIHSHVVVMNGTQVNGQWKSLSSEKLFDNKMLAGKAYRMILDRELQARGYSTEITNGKEHFIELSGVPKDAIDHFSQRRKQIIEELFKRGMTGAKAASLATLGTRRNKAEVDHSKLKQAWRERAASIGFDYKAWQRDADLSHHFDAYQVPDSNSLEAPALEFDKEGSADTSPADAPLDHQSGVDSQDVDIRLVEPAGASESMTTDSSKGVDVDRIDASDYTLSTIDTDKAAKMEREHLFSIQRYREKIAPTKRSREFINYMIKYTSERDAAFTRAEFLEQVVEQNRAQINMAVIESTIDEAIEKGKLIRKSDLELTTPGAIKVERENIQMMKRGQRSVKPMMALLAKQRVAGACKRYERNLDIKFSRGQKLGIEQALTTKDRFTGVQGRAGTGKSTMLGVVKGITEQVGYEPKFFAPTGAAVSVLKDDLKMAATTVDQHLIDVSKIKEKGTAKRELWVIDEAGMMSSRQVNRIMQAAIDQNARVLFVGDDKQLEAVEAGRPFAQLQDAGMQTTEIKSINRQKNKELLGAVYNLLDDDIEAAMEKVSDSIIENTDRSERLKKTVDLYFEKGIKDSTIILPAREDIHNANTLIRDRLKQTGELSNDCELVTMLENKDMRQVAKGLPSSYERGDVIRFYSDDKSLNIGRGEYYRVVEVRSGDKRIKIESLLKDNKCTIDPAKFTDKKHNVEVYRTASYEISPGEEMRWRRTDKKLGIVNGDVFVVKSVDKDNITIESKGIESTFSKTDIRFKHADYAYADTTYSAQGKTSKHAIVMLESYRKNLVNQKSTYVSITRASESATIITDNKADLQIAIQQRLGENTQALKMENREKPEITKTKLAPTLDLL